MWMTKFQRIFTITISTETEKLIKKQNIILQVEIIITTTCPRWPSTTGVP